MQIGKHSPKLAQLRKAIRRGSLTDHGLLPVEGPILLEEAQRSGIEIVDVFVRSGASLPGVARGRVHEVAPDDFKTIHETEHSQGVVATVRPREFHLEEILAAPTALIIVLCRLQDPGNVGTILRIAEAFGATACVGLPGTASFHNGKVVRASAGSIFRLPHVAGIELQELAAAMRTRKIKMVGAAPAAQSSIETWNWRDATALLIGNEGGGLQDDELGYCDSVLRIPHQPTVESLNSAIAAAVIMYEASKHRR
jgi:TrmH family RNA methyltransferase